MTTFVAVLGHPVGHSRSPAMHNRAFAELGMDWSYEAIDVEPERFEATVGELAGRGFAGANVTIPHKLRALELATRASDTARAVGAANTLRLGPGEIFADNTDVAGFLAALSRPGSRGTGGNEGAGAGGRRGRQGGRLCPADRGSGGRGGLEPPSRAGRRAGRGLAAPCRSHGPAGLRRCLSLRRRI